MSGQQQPSAFPARIRELLASINAHYATMLPEAKEFANRLTDDLMSMFETGLKHQADSPEKRALARQVAFVRGKHVKAELLSRSLSAPPQLQLPIVDAAPGVFYDVMQHLLDVLYDATRASHRGPARFASISLLYWCVDELLVAFHLAPRKYATQAYSHIRTVFEILEKVELFHKKPEWAEVWAGTDEKTILRELSPSAVRKKLGKAKFDPVYSFFSELGTHGTFHGVQARVAKKESDVASVGVTVWFGGVPRQDQVVLSLSYCLSAAVSVLLMAVGVFMDRLNEQEAVQKLDAAVTKAVNFETDYFAEWAAMSGMDVQPLLNALKQRPQIT